MAHITRLVVKITIGLIKKVQISLLLVEKFSILAKYLDFADVFIEKWGKVLPRWIVANKDIIKLETVKQPQYRSLKRL